MTCPAPFGCAAVKSIGRGRGGGGGATRDLAGAMDADAEDGAALVNCVGCDDGGSCCGVGDNGDANDDAAGSDAGWGSGGSSGGGGRLLTLLRIPAVVAALMVQSSVFLGI